MRFSVFVATLLTSAVTAGIVPYKTGPKYIFSLYVNLTHN